VSTYRVGKTLLKTLGNLLLHLSGDLGVTDRVGRALAVFVLHSGDCGGVGCFCEAGDVGGCFCGCGGGVFEHVEVFERG
jgi:hypothetical protein